jgi:hypothetical protein
MKFALVASGAVVAVGLVAVSVVALTAKDDAGQAADHPAPSRSFSATETVSPTESAIDPVTGRDPQGRWKVTNTVLRTTYDGEKVGAHQSFRWTFQPDCERADKCGGTIKSSSGTSFPYTWDGKVLTVTRPESTFVEEGRCFNSQTDKRVPGSHYKTTSHYQKRVEMKALGETAATHGQFAGTWTARTTYSELVNCENTFGSPSGTYRWTVAR